MGFINNSLSGIIYRTNGLNKSSMFVSLATNLMGIEEFVESGKSILSNLTDINNVISAIRIYPFSLGNFGTTNRYMLLPRITDGVLGILAKTDIPAAVISPANSYIRLGQYYVSRKYYNFLDYKPYTTIQLFLPFLGYVEVNTDEVIGKYIQVRLVNDFVSGQSMYIIGVSDTEISDPLGFGYTLQDENKIRVLSVFDVTMNVEIPIGSSNAGALKRNLVMGAVAIGAAVATGSFAPLVTSTVTTSTQTSYNIKSRSTAKGSRLKPTKVGTVDTTTTKTYSRPSDKSSKISDAISNSFTSLMNFSARGETSRPNNASISGNLSTNVIVVISRPRIYSVNKDYNHMFGMPLGISTQLKNVSGYTEITDFHLSKEDALSQATLEEINEIDRLVTNGIILPNNKTLPNTSIKLFSKLNYLPEPQGSGIIYYFNFITTIDGTLYDEIQFLRTNNILTIYYGRPKTTDKIKVYDEINGWANNIYRTITPQSQITEHINELIKFLILNKEN